MLARDVLVVIHGETESEGGQQGVLEIRIAVEGFGAVREVVVHLTNQVVLDEGLAETLAIAGKRRSAQYYRGKRSLLGAFPIAEEEQLVLDNRSAQAGPVLVALGVKILSSSRSGSHGMIAEESKRFAMKRVGPRTSGHVDRTRRREILRQIQRGLRDLEFIDCARRNVRRGSAHGLVADVDAVHVNTRGPSEAAAERDRRIPGFRGIEVLSILDLYARLELSQIKEVAPVHRQILDLSGRKYTLHRCLFGVHLHS